MFVRMGTDAPVEAYHLEVDPADHTAAELLALAAERGVMTDDKPSKDMLAARLSAVNHYRDLDGLRVVTVDIPPGMPLMQAAATITLGRGVWESHSKGQPPTWVESDNPVLAGLLAEHYGCVVGAPADVEATHYTESGPPGVGPHGPVKSSKGGK